MLRLIVYLLLIILVILAGASFASLNPGNIKLDLAFGVIDVKVSLAIVVTFLIGWLVGLLTMTGGLLKLLNDRRKLKRSVKLADAEVSNLRRLPMQDDT